MYGCYVKCVGVCRHNFLSSLFIWSSVLRTNVYKCIIESCIQCKEYVQLASQRYRWILNNYSISYMDRLIVWRDYFCACFVYPFGIIKFNFVHYVDFLLANSWMSRRFLISGSMTCVPSNWFPIVIHPGRKLWTLPNISNLRDLEPTNLSTIP